MLPHELQQPPLDGIVRYCDRWWQQVMVLLPSLVLLLLLLLLLLLHMLLVLRLARWQQWREW